VLLARFSSVYTLIDEGVQALLTAPTNFWKFKGEISAGDSALAE
jgi:hypothetical protein